MSKKNTAKAEVIKSPSMGKLRVACDVKDFLDLEDLTPLQGDLKLMDDDGHKQLRTEILTTGIAFPIKVWKDKKVNWIIGGHQTRTVLVGLQNDGYAIPMVPIVYVHCRDMDEAMHRVLQDVSQFGRINQAGLFDFMERAKLTMPQLSAGFRLPDVDMAKFQSTYFPAEKSVNFTAKDGSTEIDQSEFSQFQHKCPRCSFEFNDKK